MMDLHSLSESTKSNCMFLQQTINSMQIPRISLVGVSSAELWIIKQLAFAITKMIFRRKRAIPGTFHYPSESFQSNFMLEQQTINSLQRLGINLVGVSSAELWMLKQLAFAITIMIFDGRGQFQVLYRDASSLPVRIISIELHASIVDH